ncbi:MAG: PQQ-binding-like beta-propeller repeat protein [Candidatus Bathyarchaeota archaeon]|nr:PQQ-binding-like beta-propeller repeat protein [Candidatus Bathyarchaeum sp.]
MKIKKMNIKKTSTIIVIALLFSASFLMLSNSGITDVKAAISSDLLQYEWPHPSGAPDGACFVEGPAPTSSAVQWKVTMSEDLPNAEFLTGPLVAFNGMVFLQTNNSTVAVDAASGDIVWIAEGVGGDQYGYGWGHAISKIDDDYMLVYNKCVKIADGTVVWTGPAGFSTPLLMWTGAGYIPELKLLLDGTNAWDLSDPSQPPTKVWTRTDSIDGSGYVAYGDGKLFFGCSDSFLRAYDATNGALLWETPTTSTEWIYGMAYGDGKVFHAAIDGKMYGWDADTGKLLWTYDPNTFFSTFSSSTAYAYGIVYSMNTDTHLYAVNGTTGELIWRAKGPGVAYPGTVVIADGKVYAQMGENIYRDYDTGEYAYSEYNCYDAYTGELIWTLPMENDAPMSYHCIAYGNLYVIPTVSSTKTGEYTYSYALGRELWCISSEVKDWSMLLSDPENSADGAGPTDIMLKWKFDADAAVVSPPTLVDGVCYFGCLDSNIYAIDAADGTELWRFKTDHQVRSQLAVLNGRVYTGADDGNVYCLDAATGNLIWTASEPADGLTHNSLVRSSPTVSGDKLYVGSLDGNVYCYSISSGDLIWTYATGGTVHATPAVVDNEVYITAAIPYVKGLLIKLNADTGTQIWNFTLPYFYFYSSAIYASPTVADGVVYARSDFRYTFAVNASTGEEIWMYDGRHNPSTPEQAGATGLYDAVLYKYGKVYFNDYYGIVCLNATDASELWYTYLARETYSQGVTYSYNRLYVVTETKVLYVLDALTGEKLSYYADIGMSKSSPTPYNGELYVSSMNFGIHCFTEALPAEQYTSPPEPTYPTADEIAQKVLDNLPANPSANDIAQEIVNQLPADPEYPDVPTAEEVAQAVVNKLPEQQQATETPAEYTTIDLAILAAVIVAIIVGLVSFFALRKQK